MFVVFDLDGTLADDTHKNALLQRPAIPGDTWPEQDWSAWTAACEHDPIVEPIAAVARAMAVAGHRIEFWTGRAENARFVTERWLDKHGFCRCCHPLRMRFDEHPNLADAALKAMYLDRYGRPDLIFEDRASVVDMWRSKGIVCAQVAPGNF